MSSFVSGFFFSLSIMFLLFIYVTVHIFYFFFFFFLLNSTPLYGYTGKLTLCNPTDCSMLIACQLPLLPQSGGGEVNGEDLHDGSPH